MNNLYAIYDNVALMYSQPQGFQNDGTAIRWFEYITSNSDMVKEDLSLWQIAEYDDKSGEIIPALRKIKSYEKEIVKDVEKKEKKSK